MNAEGGDVMYTVSAAVWKAPAAGGWDCWEVTESAGVASGVPSAEDICSGASYHSPVSSSAPEPEQAQAHD